MEELQMLHGDGRPGAHTPKQRDVHVSLCIPTNAGVWSENPPPHAVASRTAWSTELSTQWTDLFYDPCCPARQPRASPWGHWALELILNFYQL